MTCPPDERTGWIVFSAFLALTGLLPAVMSVRMIRQRRLVISRNPERTIEGRAAVATGAVVLVLIADVCALMVPSLLECANGFAMSRRAELVFASVAGGILFSGLLLGAIAAMIWSARMERLEEARREHAGVARVRCRSEGRCPFHFEGP